MTGRERYPLETLLRLRDEIRSGRERSLAVATRALEQAEQQLRLAREHLDAHRGRLADERRRAFLEQTSPAAGRQAAQRFLARLEAEAEQLAQEVERCAEASRHRAEEREVARSALATAEAELKVVQKNREAWSEERRRRALARAEAELEDIVAARARGE